MTPSMRVCAMTILRVCVWVCLLTLTATLTVQPLSTLSAQDTADAERPNIIFILTDDQLASTVAYMPILQEELVAKGVSFTHAYTTSPICCPSRTSILRGQYIHNHGVLTNYPPFGGFDKFQENGLGGSTIATWLQDAGYHTALIGKFLNRYPSKDDRTYVPPGWDEWYGWWQANASEAYYTQFTLTENGEAVVYGDDESAYTTDVIGDKTVDFIRRSADQDKPFFAFVSLLAPHAPSIPAERHADLFADLPLPQPPSFYESDVSDKPAWVRAQPQLNERRLENITKLYRNQLASLQAVDEMIGSIVSTLEDTNQLHNTYIVFSSDNGTHHGIHRIQGGKGTTYTEDVLVPLIVRGPGVPQNAQVDLLVANIDLAPTFAEIAEAETPEFVDGRSLVPLLVMNTPVETWRQKLLISYLCPQFNGEEEYINDRRGEPCFNALRTFQYSYTDFPVTDEQELYDLTLDPYQLDNLAVTSPDEAAAIIAQYDAAMRAMLACKGEVCRTLESQAFE